MRPLSDWLGQQQQAPEMQPATEINDEKRERAIHDLDKLLKSKDSGGLSGPALQRHQMVLGFLNAWHLKRKQTRKRVALDVAEIYGKGTYVAEMIIRWERSWIETRTIPHDRRGHHTHLRCSLNDEGLLCCLRRVYYSKQW